MTRPALVWFRRDLRVHDHPALSAATRGHARTVGLFVVESGLWTQHGDAPAKVDFWRRSVEALRESLRALGIPLVVVRAERPDDTPARVSEVLRAHDCGALYFHHEYEVNERRRDDAVAARCAAEGVAVERLHTRLLTAPGTVLTGAAGPYTVFTPFRKRWLATLAEQGWHEAPAPQPQAPWVLPETASETAWEGWQSPVDASLWPAGEAAALARLEAFAAQHLGAYSTDRDLPALAHTSALSPHLTAGTLSPRRALARALAAKGGRLDALEGGAATWVSELAWRDFYAHILVAFPRVSMGRAFQKNTERVPWRDAPDELARWTEGRTGYPLVDAGMRQLAATGWMHNRARMVTASFLSKHLLLDWRAGERVFMDRLVDGDLAANNGGWQWSASTGTDAQPWFRVFNPYQQAARFDPDAGYIHHWVAELRKFSPKQVHDIAALPTATVRAAGYVPPMVDHATARARALAAFKGLSPALPA